MTDTTNNNSVLLCFDERNSSFYQNGNLSCSEIGEGQRNSDGELNSVGSDLKLGDVARTRSVEKHQSLILEDFKCCSFFFWGGGRIHDSTELAQSGVQTSG